MRIAFSKYDGAGNDFVVIDNRRGDVALDAARIAHICHRRKGVGADGLMLLGPGVGGYDFAMKYFNADGYAADMCGNGGRCIAAFAFGLGIGTGEGDSKRVHFTADDGPHEAWLVEWDAEQRCGTVTIGMRDVERAGVRRCMKGWLLNTGVPHYVERVQDLARFDVVGEGRRIRHLPQLGPAGANVNFVEETTDGRLMVRTYERGVEDETWACGTGVTACALVTGMRHLRTRGGDFEVDFCSSDSAYTDVRLTGPVSLNFEGTIEV